MESFIFTTLSSPEVLNSKILRNYNYHYFNSNVTQVWKIKVIRFVSLLNIDYFCLKEHKEQNKNTLRIFYHVLF